MSAQITEAERAVELEAYGRLDKLLTSLIPPEVQWSADINLKLERIAMLAYILGHPESAYPTVHIGGTSGKGTVAAMTAAILTAHGSRVGLHVSPYVELITETWQVDGKYLRPQRVLDTLRTVLEASAPIGDALPKFGAPSYFETKVATAFELFRQEKVDYGVIEVGLGGALDATNVLGPGVQVLTNVGLDHVDRLGDTVEKIATDKVQIFKPDSLVVSGVEQPSVKEIVRRQAAEVGARVYILDDDVRVGRPAPRYILLRFRGRSMGIRLPSGWPRYQQRNAALAAVAAQL
ncbi:MAG: bifunctional folylpolyglutamate synthase/dihydrofolate synthase, partial [Mycobacteriales bacterium]